jgi:hypothetical protein
MENDYFNHRSNIQISLEATLNPPIHSA